MHAARRATIEKHTDEIAFLVGTSHGASRVVPWWAHAPSRKARSEAARCYAIVTPKMSS